ncbi:unnamed protein product [Dicrocoelium dendriticum]|nr:unnamed protein product [Dicrocoelium dendriticum]
MCLLLFCLAATSDYVTTSAPQAPSLWERFKKAVANLFGYGGQTATETTPIPAATSNYVTTPAPNTPSRKSTSETSSSGTTPTAVITVASTTTAKSTISPATLTTGGCMRRTNSRAFVIDLLLLLLIPMVLI